MPVTSCAYLILEGKWLLQFAALFLTVQIFRLYCVAFNDFKDILIYKQSILLLQFLKDNICIVHVCSKEKVLFLFVFRAYRLDLAVEE